MGAIGFGVGLVMGYFSGTLNEYTTGATLTGMALYIPVGILAYHLYLKRLY
jgi:ABC-type dipeptide/oligopeptide/nickel transport system permease subunit